MELREVVSIIAEAKCKSPCSYTALYEREVVRGATPPKLFGELD